MPAEYQHNAYVYLPIAEPNNDSTELCVASIAAIGPSIDEAMFHLLRNKVNGQLLYAFHTYRESQALLSFRFNPDLT